MLVDKADYFSGVRITKDNRLTIDPKKPITGIATLAKKGLQVPSGRAQAYNDAMAVRDHVAIYTTHHHRLSRNQEAAAYNLPKKRIRKTN
jgi:hypothetical protein